MPPSLPQFDARRVRSYLFRLPLCTRALLLVIVAFWIASLRLSWFSQWAALIPSEMNPGTSTYSPSAPTRAIIALSDPCPVVYRLNTFPLLHVGFLHMIVNLLALTPLLERFEAENGSLPTLLLFTGRSSLLLGPLLPPSNAPSSIRSSPRRQLHLG
jgi:membrane associated rhomboid family serine protease